MNLKASVITFLAISLWQNSILAEIIVGPYIQNVKETSVVICWRTNKPEAGKVRYGETLDYEHTIDSPISTKHEVVLNGLEQSKLYYYQVVSGEESLPVRVRTQTETLSGNPSYYFSTALKSREPFIFAVIGDTRSGISGFDSDHRQVIEAIIIHSNPDFLLHCGDLVDRSDDENQWISFFSIERELLVHCAIYPVYGTSDLSGNYFADYFLLPNKSPQIPFSKGGRRGWYSFNYGGCHFIGLYIWDGLGVQPYSEFEPGSEQYNWLINDLESQKDQNALFTIVFLHAPFFSPTEKKSKVLIDHLCPLFKKYGVDLVFSGTSHCYSHAIFNGIHYVISGGGGAELLPQKVKYSTPIIEYSPRFHHCRVTVNYPILTVEAVDTGGNVFSTFSIE
jgi:hypothetical protein